MSTLFSPLASWPKRQPLLFLTIAGAVWLGLYQLLQPLSEAFVAALPVVRDSHLGGALQFFLYDTPKVLLLLTGVVRAAEPVLHGVFAIRHFTLQLHSPGDALQYVLRSGARHQQD